MAIGLAAALAGTGLWHWSRSPASVSAAAPAIAPAAIYATSFVDEAGRPQALGRFQGDIVVLNFWATWCAPCREEMPAFQRLHDRWSGRGIRFVGLSAEDPDTSSRFGRELGITYALWTGEDQVATLSRRLGNTVGGLPHTVVLGREGEVLQQRVGPYTQAELDALLTHITAKKP